MLQGDNANIEPATHELAAKDTFRILIMDTVEHANLLKEACKDAGHSVVAVHSIKEAFFFLDGRNHADVIVCAAYMEDESMFEFLQRLRSNPIHKDSMFMTLALESGPMATAINDSTQRAGTSLGADAFVSMPVFDAPLLIREIQKLLPLVPLLEKTRLQDEKSRKNLPGAKG